MVIRNVHRIRYLTDTVSYGMSHTVQVATRGSNFWSSKVCEGGESREAYACRLTFGPPQFLFEIDDHVTQTHFWSAFKLIENSLLVQFELMKSEFSNSYILNILMGRSRTRTRKGTRTSEDDNIRRKLGRGRPGRELGRGRGRQFSMA